MDKYGPDDPSNKWLDATAYTVFLMFMIVGITLSLDSDAEISGKIIGVVISVLGWGSVAFIYRLFSKLPIEW